MQARSKVEIIEGAKLLFSLFYQQKSLVLTTNYGDLQIIEEA